MVEDAHLHHTIERLKEQGVMITADGRIPEAGAAEHLLGVPISRMRRWRSEGKGPPFYKLGRDVFYPVRGVLEWIKMAEGLSDVGGV